MTTETDEQKEWRENVQIKLNATVVLLLAIAFQLLIMLVLLSAILGQLKRQQ